MGTSELPEAMRTGDRGEDVQRGREMTPYWEAIPEVRRPGDRSTFENWDQAAAALEAAFPVLSDQAWHTHRSRLGLTLLGAINHTPLAVFKKLAEEVRAGRVRAMPGLFDGVGDDIEELPEAAPAKLIRTPIVTPQVTPSEPTNREIRSLLIILAVLMIGLILVSVLYTHGNDIEIRAEVAGNSTRIEAIDERVDRVDIRTADLATALISEKSTVVELKGEKEQLEATFISLKGELGKIVDDQVREQRRKDVDVKIEIQKVSDRLEYLQTELDRLRQERESKKESP